MRQLHGQGLSCQAIAREIGRSAGTVSRHCAAEGLSFDRSKVKSAVEARVVDISARRAAVSEEFIDLTALMTARMRAELEDAGAEVKPWRLRDYAYAVGALFDRHLSQAEFDKPTSDDGSAVDRWLRAMTGTEFPAEHGALPDWVIRPPATPADANLPGRDELPPDLQPWDGQ